MSVSRTLGVLNLYDVVTDLIPGTLFLGAFFYFFPVFLPSTKPSVLLAGLIIGGYITGHIIRFARNIRYAPTGFQDRLHDPGSHIEESVIQQLGDQFELPDREPSSGENDDTQDNLFPDVPDTELMPLVLAYLETRPAVRALRMQAFYSFYRSIFTASVGVVVLALAAAAITLVKPSVTESLLRISTGLILGIVGTVVFFYRREKYEKNFVKYAFRDFYTDSVVDTE